MVVAATPDPATTASIVTAGSPPVPRAPHRLAQDGDRVTATLRREDGSEEEVVADYLVGADGAHSPLQRCTPDGFVTDDLPVVLEVGSHAGDRAH